MTRIVKVTYNDNEVRYAIEDTYKPWFRREQKRYLDLDIATYSSYRWTTYDNSSERLSACYTRNTLTEVVHVFKKLNLPLFTTEPVAASELEKVVYDI